MTDNPPKVTYEIRELVKTVKGAHFAVLESSPSDRLSRLTYHDLVSEHPSVYFELVKVQHSEECLEFTADR